MGSGEQKAKRSQSSGGSRVLPVKPERHINRTNFAPALKGGAGASDIRLELEARRLE
jgi:hypothetical protein